MLTLAQKVYLASLARKEAAMPWEDDESYLPEIAAGLGTAGLLGGGAYAPTLAEKAIRQLAGEDLGRGYRLQGDTKAARKLNRLAEMKALRKDGVKPIDIDGILGKAAKTRKYHQYALKGRNSIYKALEKIGAKGPKSRAAIVAALAGLGGAGAAGLTNLLSD